MMIKYLHFGCQCPGWAYMEQGAREAAQILGEPFQAIDVSVHPEEAGHNQMYFPGMIVAGDLKLVYPGTGAQIAASVQAGGPLPGEHVYHQLPHAIPDRVELLGPENLELIQGLCMPAHRCSGWDQKGQWLLNQNRDVLGLVGFKAGEPVVVMEILPREDMPYPLPEYQGLFITCLYGRHDTSQDYRPGLLTAGLPLLADLGYPTLGIVVGRETPYPNGPAAVLAQAGFQEQQALGRVLFRHRWEDILFMAREL